MTRMLTVDQEAERIMRGARWSPKNVLLALGNAVCCSRRDGSTSLALPYGMGSVVLARPTG